MKSEKKYTEYKKLDKKPKITRSERNKKFKLKTPHLCEKIFEEK